MDVSLSAKWAFMLTFMTGVASSVAAQTLPQPIQSSVPSDAAAVMAPQVQQPQPLAQQPSQQTQPSPQLVPTVVRGPAGSQLVGVQEGPSYTSSLGAYLGLDSRESSDMELSRYFNSTSRRRVVKVPEMFGDYRRFSGISSIDGEVTTGPPPPTNNDQPSILDVPNAGGISGLKIGENNQAITSNRLWFSYNRMYDAVQIPNNNGGFQDQNLDRFTIGWERTFFDGACSIEARMPLAGTLSPDLNYDPGVVGDLSLIFKKLLYADQRRATAVGLGVELPTGDSSYIWTNNVSASLDSDTVFLVPYLATSQLLTDVWFCHCFTQIAIPTGEDDLHINYTTNGPAYGTVTPPLTASLDAALGYWIVPPLNLSACGLALILEAHYTSVLDSGDVNAEGISFNQSNLNSLPDDVLNITSAAHAQMSGDWSLRVGYSVPVTEDELFGSELIFQILHSK